MLLLLLAEGNALKLWFRLIFFLSFCIVGIFKLIYFYVKSLRRTVRLSICFLASVFHLLYLMSYHILLKGIRSFPLFLVLFGLRRPHNQKLTYFSPIKWSLTPTKRCQTLCIILFIFIWCPFFLWLFNILFNVGNRA